MARDLLKRDLKTAAAPLFFYSPTNEDLQITFPITFSFAHIYMINNTYFHTKTNFCTV